MKFPESYAKSYAEDWRKYMSKDAYTLSVGLSAFDRWNLEVLRLCVGLDAPTEMKRRVAASFFQLGMEHAVSIAMLLHKNMIASARALFRSQFEAFVRGAWFLYCAKEDKLEAFLSGDKSAIPDFTSLTNALDKAIPGASLSVMRTAYWSTLNDFSHGGKIQVTQRLQGADIESTYGVWEAVTLLELVTHLACLTVGNLAFALGRTDFANQVQLRFEEIFPGGW